MSFYEHIRREVIHNSQECYEAGWQDAMHDVEANLKKQEQWIKDLGEDIQNLSDKIKWLKY